MTTGNPEIDALLAVMPAEHGRGEGFDWPVVEASLGHRLPTDYKTFMDVYGSGSLPGLSIEPPVLPDEYPYTSGGIAEETANLRHTLEHPWHDDPMPEGLRQADQLVAWGVGHHDPDLYGWIMTGDDPDTWPVVVWRRHRGPELVRFDMGMVEFLRRLVTADLDDIPGSNDSAWGNRGPYIGWREDRRRSEDGLGAHTGESDPEAKFLLGLPEVRPLPDWLSLILSGHETPVRLAVHLRLVHDVAVSLLDGLAEAYPDLRVDREAVEFGAATHDIGKIVHRSELTGPGSDHEEAGRQMLLTMGHDEHLARFAATHGTWDSPDRRLEDLLVTVADKVWKGKRISELEERVADMIAELTGKDRWQVFLAVDQLCEDLAGDSDERLAFHSAAPVHIGPHGPLAPVED
ncbi:HD domain-containing protein [Antribacter gilvus]|uniref:HD domain-containing protein n=1 Tax=Antribacter gilvus TaxID=2304675 RepID=UPI00197D8323|nr:HD domain-containing protein [Antribacter gilvus]